MKPLSSGAVNARSHRLPSPQEIRAIARRELRYLTIRISLSYEEGIRGDWKVTLVTVTGVATESVASSPAKVKVSIVA